MKIFRTMALLKMAPRRAAALLAALCLLLASAPGVTHALMHAAVSVLEHSHDGDAPCHLHHDTSHHDDKAELLPPACNSRARAWVPHLGGAAMIASSAVLPAASGALSVRLYEKLFRPLRPDLIPQISAIPPPVII